MKGIRILVAEDEDKLRDIILKYLKKEEYKGIGASNGEEALNLWAEQKPDCVILDVTMPVLDGFEVLKEIRERDNTPVIMLTARREEEDKIKGFSVGADDYVTKPFSPRELMVRIKALLKRSGIIMVKKEVEVSGIHIDSENRSLMIADKKISLTQKEYDLFLYLTNHLNKTLSREQILERIWGFDYDGDMRVVDTAIKRLRKKLDEKGDYIQTVRGIGYKFQK